MSADLMLAAWFAAILGLLDVAGRVSACDADDCAECLEAARRSAP
jgi:hypothetical protein